MEHDAPEGLARVFLGIFGNRCPRCFTGRVFSGLVGMHERCSSCELAFHREPGYYTASMSFSYAVGGVTIFPLFFGLAAAGYSVPIVVGVPSTLVLVMAPALFRLSRLTWLHMDWAATGERPEEARTPRP